jgi:hypothetical protein
MRLLLLLHGEPIPIVYRRPPPSNQQRFVVAQSMAAQLFILALLS